MNFSALVIGASSLVVACDPPQPLDRVELVSGLPRVTSVHWVDRGTVPAARVRALIALPIRDSAALEAEIVKLRWDAQEMGFEKLTIKRETMKGYLPTENNEKYFQSEVFGNVLGYVQAHSKNSRLKDTKDKLIVIFDNVKTIRQAREIFAELLGKR